MVENKNVFNFDNVDKKRFLNGLKWSFISGLLIGGLCLAVGVLLWLLPSSDLSLVSVVHAGAAGSMMAAALVLALEKPKTRAGIWRLIATAASRLAGIMLIAVIVHVLF